MVELPNYVFEFIQTEYLETINIHDLSVPSLKVQNLRVKITKFLTFKLSEFV